MTGRNLFRNTAITCAAALALSAPAWANDSEAEWALGGLELKANPDISMDSEDLYISPSEVRVSYIYTNHSDADREVLIAFPLPALPESEGEYDHHSWNDLSFETRVNGQPVEFEVHDRAIIGSRDVTDLVLAEGWQIDTVLDMGFYDALQNLPEETKQRLVQSGLLSQHGSENGHTWVGPLWQAQRSYLRRQTFPAGASVSVTHRYTPYVGGSVGGSLDADLQSNPDRAETLAYYQDKWCTDASFLNGIKRRQERAKPGHNLFVGETWLGYILSSGANWRGPIGKFRLVVDKEDPETLVSFCMNGVKKISPTQFEVVKTNFEPTGDLDILIAHPHEVNLED